MLRIVFPDTTSWGSKSICRPYIFFAFQTHIIGLKWDKKCLCYLLCVIFGQSYFGMIVIFVLLEFRNFPIMYLDFGTKFSRVIAAFLNFIVVYCLRYFMAREMSMILWDFWSVQKSSIPWMFLHHFVLMNNLLKWRETRLKRNSVVTRKLIYWFYPCKRPTVRGTFETSSFLWQTLFDQGSWGKGQKKMFFSHDQQSACKSSLPKIYQNVENLLNHFWKTVIIEKSNISQFFKFYRFLKHQERKKMPYENWAWLSLIIIPNSTYQTPEFPGGEQDRNTELYRRGVWLFERSFTIKRAQRSRHGSQQNIEQRQGRQILPCSLERDGHRRRGVGHALIQNSHLRRVQRTLLSPAKASHTGEQNYALPNVFPSWDRLPTNKNKKKIGIPRKKFVARLASYNWRLRPVWGEKRLCCILWNFSYQHYRIIQTFLESFFHY